MLMTDKMKSHPDPLIDEVRERRRQLWADYGNDLDKVYEAIQRLQAEHPQMLSDPRKSRKANMNK